MKRKSFIVLLVIGVVGVLSSYLYLNDKIFEKKTIAQKLVNISKVSDSFMDKYLEESEKLLQSDNRENVLIIVSKKKPKKENGEVNIIEAPNNTYFLEYASEEDKMKALKKYQEDKDIYSVEENRKYEFTGDSDNEKEYNSWGIEKVGLNHAIDLLGDIETESITAAIIDTGCDMELFNESFAGKIEEVYNLYETDTYGNDTMFDNFGHGTHIAGTIAEGTPDNVKILPIKISDANYIDTVAELTAINYITHNHKADVINMSFGGYYNYENYNTSAEYIAIEAAKQENIISVAAAGNEATSDKHYPSAYDNTISISAVDSNLNLAEFSNYGDSITFAAPGVDIKSINDTYSGTSMATPHAVSAVAILKSINKNLSLEEVIEVLKEKAVDLGVKGYDKYFGYGFINFNNVKLCEDSSTQDCDQYNIFQVINPKEIEVSELKLTNYNYGSLTNILATEIKIKGNYDNYEIKALGDLEGVEISGYDPYSTEEQNVTIKYLDFETTVTVKNPDNYELGWTYEHDPDDYNSLVINGYKDNLMNIRTLYFPSTIEGYEVTTLKDTNDFREFSVFKDSEDARNYKEIVLPETITDIGSYMFIRFKKLEKFTSLADNINLKTASLAYLPSLVEVNANIVLNKKYSSAFYDDKMLEKVTLSPDTSDTIPSSTFAGCRSLENIDIPDSVTTIDYNAFWGTGIKSIEFTENIESIGEYAFSRTKLRSVYIPSSVVNIGIGAFAVEELESITVSKGNSVYDSRDNCNAIIETETSKLIAGSLNTVIPNNVTIIGTGAFETSLISEISLSAGYITTIENGAFYLTGFLEKVIIPSSVTYIGNNNFDYGWYTSTRSTVLWVYDDSYAKEYAINNNNTYKIIDDPNNDKTIEAIWFWYAKDEYKPFEKVDLNDFYIDIRYKGIDEEERITDITGIKYQSADDGFRAGDYMFTVIFNTSNGYYNLKKDIFVNVGKLTPEYTIPTDIKANINQRLSEISLPEGFEWMDDSIMLDEEGNKVYNARFIPEDTDNYEIVENISIPVTVVNKEIIRPTIQVDDVVYGESLFDSDKIHVSGIDKEDYTIISAYLNRASVGSQTATIKIKLSDEKFENYSFEGALQEKKFIVDVNVLPYKMAKPTLRDKTYVYNGREQKVLLDNYNNEKMLIDGNKRTDAGSQDVIIMLKNINYAWEDGSTDDVILTFTIEKKELTIDDRSENVTVPYDGEEHTILYRCFGTAELADRTEHAEPVFMDEHGDYTLMYEPKYTEVGTYVIKYKLSLGDNFTEYYGERTLTIEEAFDYEINNYDVDEENKYIKGIEVNTEVNNFTPNITLGYGYGIDVDSTEINGKNVLYTGGKTKINKGIEPYREYTNVVLGDTSGDGKITYLDYVKIYNHIQKDKHPELENNLLTGEYLLAADMSGDNKIGYLDYVKVYNKIRELKGE